MSIQKNTKNYSSVYNLIFALLDRDSQGEDKDTEPSASTYSKNVAFVNAILICH